MQNNAPHSGLLALDIISPKRKIAFWLRELAEHGCIASEDRAEALRHFGLTRGAADWNLFLKRIFALLGVILLVCGLIFFMAWNWEDLGRFAKFGVAEGVFAIFAAYAWLRWPKNVASGPRWDARVALLGAAFSIGGLLALYGQIYQTGADAWELFRAWALMLLVLALPGRATVFWFMAWLVANLWIGLYLGFHLEAWRWSGADLTLLMALAQFAFLALNEAARLLLARRGLDYDHGRWLSRIIGSAAIIGMAFYALTALGLDSGWSHYNGYNSAGIGLILYLSSLGLTFFIYYRLIPELLFLALSLFSLAAYFCLKIGDILFNRLHSELGGVLLLGLIILACAFACMKLILWLRSAIKARALKDEQSLTHGTHSLGLFKSREAQKAELRAWLLQKGAANAADIDELYARDEATSAGESPWYAKVFVSLGVWIGSGLSLGAATFLLFDDLRDFNVLGIFGLLFCGASIQLGSSPRLAVRSFSQVLAICGLIYAGLLFDFEELPTLTLMTLLFGLFWLLKPPFAARAGAFMGALISFGWLSNWGQYSRYGDFDSPGLVIRSAAYIFGLLWAAHYLVVMGGRPPLWLKKPGGWLASRFDAAEIMGASAYGSLIFFSALAVCLPHFGRELRILFVEVPLCTAIVFAALAALMAWRYPAARPAALVLGPLLAVTAWFAPTVAIGLGLVLLAYHIGSNALFAAAAAYLGWGIFFYYYSLSLSLLHKSLALAGSGLFFLLLSFFSARFKLEEHGA